VINLMYGDCLEKMKCIEGGSVDLVLTDPPYKMTKRGQSCRPNYMEINDKGNFFNGSLPDTRGWMSECYRVMTDSSHFYTFTNTNSLSEFLVVAEDVGFKLHNVITMIKDTNMPNRWYLKYSEIVLFFRKGGAVPINDMTSRDYEFVNMPTQKNGKLHPSQKPLGFMEKLVSNSSGCGDLVLDPFMGSGSTGVACSNLNRRFIGIEADTNYFNIAADRIQSTKGEQL